VTGPFVLLPWDSEFFGVTIGRVTTLHLTPALGADLLRWTTAHDVECVYFLANPCDTETLRVAHDVGFRLVDVRVTLTASTERDVTVQVEGIRAAASADIGALESIARASHHDTRFYADGRFDPDRCDDMYATWIARSCRGEADFVLVAEQNSQPAGYVTGHADPDGSGRIGLIAVAETARGGGRGTNLVSAALGWFHAKNIGTVTVVTQARNLAALALYQRCGFHVSRVDLWYHRWTVSASPR
jgi:dTDP-4-amino-4,6-dideoxy-D-galactose acyltransferase